MAEVAALIPTLGMSPERVLRAVTGVLASTTTRSIEVIIVVNAASEPFTEAGVVLPSSVRVIVAGANLGWAGGLHVGRMATEARLLWFVQDDLVPDPDCLEALARVIDRGEFDLASPIVVDAPVRDSAGRIVGGTLPQHSLGASLNPVLMSGDGVTLADASLLIDRQPPLDVDLDEFGEPATTDYVPSRGMMLAASTWDRVGGMDPRFYPIGVTDVDFCRALASAGFRFGSIRAARSTHERAASTTKALSRVVFARNRQRVIDKWMRRSAQDASISPVVPDALRDSVLVSATEVVADLAAELERVTAQRDRLRARLRSISSDVDAVENAP